MDDLTTKGTYVLNQEDPVEMARLIDLDRVITGAMGNAFVGVPHLQADAKILDLACGPGGWVLDMAFTFPECEVAGVDISQIMIDYANARARTQKLPNASFGVMDITQPLDFSDQTFDMVNARFLVAVLLREKWPAFLVECTRILKPGGTFRLTEPFGVGGFSNSPAYTQIMQTWVQALWKRGYGFSCDGHDLGMVAALPTLLREYGYFHVRCLAHVLDFSHDQITAWGDMERQIEAGAALAAPFLVSTGMMMEKDIHPLYQQAIMEMHMSTFRGVHPFATITGEKP